MDFETLKFVCKNNQYLQNIPFHIYRGKELIKSYETVPFHVDLSNKYLDDLYNTDLNLNVILTPRTLLFSMIRVKDLDMSIIIGPSRSVHLPDTEIRDILIDFDLKLSHYDELKHYLNSIRIMAIESFVLISMTLNSLINNEIVPFETFYNDVIPYDVEVDIYKRVVDYLDGREEVPYDSFRYLDHEKKTMFYIKHGMQEKLIEHLSKGYQGGRPTSFATNALRQYKDRCISMTTLVSRAAMDGGLDSDIAYKLFDLYCMKVEQASSIDTLNKVQGNMLYDYVKRVRAYHYSSTDDPAVNRAVAYIHSNINSKLTVSEIANKINISNGYLSVKFKDNIGVSIPTYIKQQKIKEAKNLLQFTDRSLVEISEYLSFSSQCYFQNVFKQTTGQTPMEYRRSCESKTIPNI